jgi:hypothetical protein
MLRPSWIAPWSPSSGVRDQQSPLYRCYTTSLISSRLPPMRSIFATRAQMISFSCSWSAMSQTVSSTYYHRTRPRSRLCSGADGKKVGALFSPLRFKVLLSISNLQMHVWSVNTIHAIVSSTCLVHEVAPTSENKDDLSKFLVVV